MDQCLEAVRYNHMEKCGTTTLARDVEDTVTSLSGDAEGSEEGSEEGSGKGNDKSIEMASLCSPSPSKTRKRARSSSSPSETRERQNTKGLRHPAGSSVRGYAKEGNEKASKRLPRADAR